MKTSKEMNKNKIAMLQYRMERYKAMGDGVTCQSLNTKIHKLMAEQEKA